MSKKPDEKLRVAIIGAGFGGLCAAARLKESGIGDFLIFDRNAKVGGVWHENKYPGCACDVPVALYHLSFAPSGRWSHLFPRSDEVQAYAEEVVERFQLKPRLRLSEEIRAARWDEAARCWRLTLASGGEIEADAVIAGLGQLNRPVMPDIEGLARFAGPVMHSARWDRALALAGKRVGVIGSGASAVQLIPEVAQEAAHLTVFQRTPNWVVPRLDRPISDEEKALMATNPEAALRIAQANRQMIYENADHFFWQAFAWTKQGRDFQTLLAKTHLEEQVSDPALRKKLTPDYPIGCKRILFSDDFYPCLLREDVDLVTEKITRIVPDGVEIQDGSLHKLDVLVCATGFETTGWHWSLDIEGRAGTRLAEAWREGPEAYLGITVSGFPNFFVLYGPNTNLGHNSILVMIEDQVNYAVKALKLLEEKGARALMPSPEAQARFNAQLQKDLRTRVWADPNCTSWYKNAQGKITQNWSSHTRDYAAATSSVNLADYELIA